MRILLLNYEFPPLGGGAATASAQIARHLAGRGVEVAVLTSHFRGLERVVEARWVHNLPGARDAQQDRPLLGARNGGLMLQGRSCLLCGWQRSSSPT